MFLQQAKSLHVFLLCQTTEQEAQVLWDFLKMQTHLASLSLPCKNAC